MLHLLPKPEIERTQRLVQQQDLTYQARPARSLALTARAVGKRLSIRPSRPG